MSEEIKDEQLEEKPEKPKRGRKSKGKEKSKAKPKAKKKPAKERTVKKPKVEVPEVVEETQDESLPEIDPSKVLIVCNHHRRIGYFDDTIRMLWNDGFKHILLNDTSSSDSTAHLANYAGRFHSRSASYDQGMVRLKEEVDKKIDNYDIVLLLDNDCFLKGTEHLRKLIQEYYMGNYQLLSHVVDPVKYDEVHNKKREKIVVEVENPTIEVVDQYPGILPNPHFENSYTLISATLWAGLEVGTYGHSRKWYCEMIKKGAKMGSHKCEYRMKYSHMGDEWFHIGNLMAYIYAIEDKNWDKFDQSSELDMSRLGFLAICNRKYTDHWPAEFQHSITAALHKCGAERAEKAWRDLAKGTCMEGWE